MYDIYIYVYMIDNSRTNIPIIVISRKHRNVTQPVFFMAVGMVVNGLCGLCFGRYLGWITVPNMQCLDAYYVD